jgi:hypothetical protein
MSNGESTKPVDFSTEKFLLINVPKGASRAKLIETIDEALKNAPDIPFFMAKQRPPTDAASKEKIASAPCEHDGLVMMMRQEGW